MYQMYQTEAVYLLSVESSIIFNARPGCECVVFLFNFYGIYYVLLEYILLELELVGHNRET